MHGSIVKDISIYLIKQGTDLADSQTVALVTSLEVTQIPLCLYFVSFRSSYLSGTITLTPLMKPVWYDTLILPNEYDS